MFTYTVIFNDRQSRCVKCAEDLLDVLHVALDLLLIILLLLVWRTYSAPPKSALDLAHSPGTFQHVKREGSSLINAPFQVLHRHPLGLAEVTGIFSLERAFECFARMETVFRQLHDIFVVNHRVLVEESTKVQALIVGTEWQY